MAEHNLNLKVTRPDENTVRVTWDDPVLAGFSKKAASRDNIKYNIFLIIPILSYIVLGFSYQEPAFLFIFVFHFIIWGVVVISLPPCIEQRTITFTPDAVIHEGKSYPTERITRFEYGRYRDLKGVSAKGEKPNPPLIRMWIDDAKAVEVSVNNWQTQVNHEIRDALDRALTTVRQEQAKAKQAETYGQQDDKGLPDY